MGNISTKHIHPFTESDISFPFLDNDISHKEFYDMQRNIKDISEWEKNGCALYEKNPWLTGELEAKHSWIKETFDKEFEIMRNLSLRLLRYLSVALGKSANYFDDWFTAACTSELRAIHYKPRSESTVKSD